MSVFRHYCRGCGTFKPDGAFYASSPTRCKDCVKAKVAAYREANIEQIRAYDRSRGFRGRPTLSADYGAKYPERRRAQVALNNALRDGRIQSWPACANPGCDDKPEAHHVDYSRPLEVVWLCPAHHKQAHALIRKAA